MENQRMRRLIIALSLLAVGRAEAMRFRGVELPPSGKGYLVPSTWAQRGLRWGTPELVGLLQRAARRLRAWDPGATVYVGDLSLKNGAATKWHKSHRRGVDADLLLFAAGRDGKQLPPPQQMRPFSK